MEKCRSATRSANLPHLYSSFSSVLLCLVSHDKSHFFTVCSVFHRMTSQGFLKLPETLFLFPVSSPVGKRASQPIFNCLPLSKPPWSPTPYSGHHRFPLYLSQANFWKKLFIHISSTLPPLIHTWTYLFWFIPFGYKNVFLSRPLSAFELPNRGVCLPLSPSYLTVGNSPHGCLLPTSPNTFLFRGRTLWCFQLIPLSWLLSLPCRVFLFIIPKYRTLALTFLFLCYAFFNHLINSIRYNWHFLYLYLQPKPFHDFQLPTWHPPLNVSQAPNTDLIPNQPLYSHCFPQTTSFPSLLNPNN